jgi:Icc-related predicted phosphoesterase
MKKIMWATDIHLGFADQVNSDRFIKEARSGDALIISGDISNGNDLKHWLMVLSNQISIPIYFVLGNHDYYHRSFDEVHGLVRRLVAKQDNLFWLTELPDKFVEIDEGIAVVGHEGWYDCRNGRLGRIKMNDFYYIKNFKPLNAPGKISDVLISEFRRLTDEAIKHIEGALEEAFKHYEKVLMVTHVPPFREAAWHKGEISESPFLPLMSSKAMGEMLVRVMANINKELVVLCGHTHSPGVAQILPNLKVLTGKGEYHFPEANILEL